MNRDLYPKFAAELRMHGAPGYHVSSGPVEMPCATEWFGSRSIRCPESFSTFLRCVGTGSFFGGSLVLFPLQGGGNTIENVTARLPEPDRSKVFAVGNDGTTEGCYCLDRSGDKPTVFWHNFGIAETATLHPDFAAWIEECPGQLFNEQIYAGYGNVRDAAGVRAVIKERAALEVLMLKAETTKVRPPGQEKDLLPRYNHIIIGIRKLRESHLRKLTLSVHRTGSSIGPKNVEYVTIDLPDFPPGAEVTADAYVFDPFNLPFKQIEVIHTPEIDLSSPMRVRFEEIKNLL